MPELPEVQTIINRLDPELRNVTITNVKLIKPKCVKNTSPDNFINTLKGEKILYIDRRAKHLIFHLTNDKVMIIHLRMEGSLHHRIASTSIERHAMVVFELDNGKSLRYVDTRQFGTFHLYNENNYKTSDQIGKLGPEPWDKELTVEYLKQRFSRSRRPIKTTLLDQTILSGIGNIYADEILFACKLNPLKPANELNEHDVKNIIEANKRIMEKAIEKCGSTIRSFKIDHNTTGSFQGFLKVHSRKGRPCPECGQPISKITVNGRGTYFCAGCQKW